MERRRACAAYATCDYIAPVAGTAANPVAPSLFETSDNGASRVDASLCWCVQRDSDRESHQAGDKGEDRELHG